LQTILPVGQSNHVRILQAVIAETRRIAHRAVVSDGSVQGVGYSPLRIADEEVVDLSGGINVVVAEKDTFGDPVKQSVSQHQIVLEVLVTVESLRYVLPSVAEVIEGGEHVARIVGQQRSSTATRGCAINRGVGDGQRRGGIDLWEDRSGGRGEMRGHIGSGVVVVSAAPNP